MAKRNNKSRSAATVGYEAQLWQMADALRGSMDAGLQGPEHFAYEAVAVLLGLWAGCTVQVVEGWVVTPEHPDEIDRLVAIAREGRARGVSIATMADAGRFDRAGRGESKSP